MSGFGGGDEREDGRAGRITHHAQGERASGDEFDFGPGKKKKKNNKENTNGRQRPLDRRLASPGSPNSRRTMSAFTHLFSATLAGGGLFAFMKTGSAASLVAAGGSALIFSTLEYLISADLPKKAGKYGSAARSYSAAQAFVALVLCGVMLGRAANSGKVMPGVPVAALAGVATVLFALRAVSR